MTYSCRPIPPLEPNGVRQQRRPASQVSTISTPIAARINQRQSFWRFSSSALYIWRSSALIERLRGMARQTATQLFQGVVFERGRLAFQRVEVDRKRPSAVRACRPYRHRDCRYRRKRCRSWAKPQSSHPDCGQSRLAACFGGRHRHAIEDQVQARSQGRGGSPFQSIPSSRERISTTAQADCQPAASRSQTPPAFPCLRSFR